jgi:hypothetical protein
MHPCNIYCYSTFFQHGTFVWLNVVHHEKECCNNTWLDSDFLYGQMLYIYCYEQACLFTLYHINHHAYYIYIRQELFEVNLHIVYRQYLDPILKIHTCSWHCVFLI